MDEKKLARLEKLYEEANRDFLTLEQAQNLFSVLQGAVQDAKITQESLVSRGNTDNSTQIEQMKKDISSFEKGVDKVIKTLQKNTEQTIEEKLQKAVESVMKLIPKIPDPIIFDPTSLQNQIDVLMAYESPKIEAGEIRDLLEVLKGEERLDASAIKNLPEATKTVVEGMNKALALYMLIDMDLAGIQIGQSIKWDGVRWIPYTPAGGGGTAVYNEVVAGSNNTWTLAFTPNSGTLRVYANGQRLLPTTDYTLVGATITTVLAWASGTLTADYEH